MSARILTVGVVPPERGPHRVDWCVEHGAPLLDAARKSFGMSLLRLVSVLPGGLPDLIPEVQLHREHDLQAATRIGDERVKLWTELRHQVRKSDRDARCFERTLDQSAWDEADRYARAALRDAAEAFHLLHEAGVEARSIEGYLVENPEFCAGLDRNADHAHALAHSSGELVGGLFGCFAVNSDGVWMNHCVLEHMHVGYGMSAGFTARHQCSICRQNLTTCPHILGQPYLVSVTHDGDGTCNVCDEAGCHHQVGDTVSVRAGLAMTDATLHEVSMTPRPRDPRARLDGVEIDLTEIVEALGRQPRPDDKIRTHGCMYPCTGFSTAPSVSLA
jgi:hypothetical protein